jgi:hypothetical protein
MLDPIVNFFTWVFQWIGRGIGLVDEFGDLLPGHLARAAGKRRARD